MASGPEHDVEQLNSLIKITLDSAQCYSDAANEAGSSRFAALFRERGTQRHEIAGRLQARVKSLGGDAGKSESALGASGQLFADLKQKLTGADASIIAAVEAGEDHVQAAYQRVITDGELSDPVRMAVESEFAQMQANHDEPGKMKRGTI
jgi:uncharacterized protein (TIGR02284 family)